MSVGEMTHSDTINMILDGFNKILNWNEVIPGNSQIECGNCDTLNLETAKDAVEKFNNYLLTIEDVKNMKY